jgi:hypothetical protein
VRKYFTAQCRTRRGGVHEVRVLDISTAGLMVDKRAVQMEEGDRVLIKLPGLAWLPLSVLWIEDARAGLLFEEPLYAAVLEHLQQCIVVEGA